ncbi:MAG: DUF86 domain-containing protein [Actinobacteria bacterium ATB1]|nr:DUF86 domain-containing protein [Actinobacteria bacterium ATB1]
MVDPDRLRLVLQAISDSLARLRTYATEDRDAVLEARGWLDAIKYLFVVSIEGCVDAAQHVCASEGWGPPASNAAAMTVLAEHGVLDADHARRMVRAVGFRNVLVHRYRAVDDDVVLDNLDRLSDIDEFVAAVARML